MPISRRLIWRQATAAPFRLRSTSALPWDAATGTA